MKFAPARVRSKITLKGSKPNFVKPLLSIVLLSTLAFSGCSFIERNTLGLFSSEPSSLDQEETDSSNSKTELNSAADKINNAPFALKQQSSDLLQQTPTITDSSQLDEVELLWRIPEEEVDNFIIHLGYDKDLLNQELIINPSQTEKIEHPKYGLVYRYILAKQPKDKPIFITISSVKNTVVSAPTPVMEIQR